MLVTKLTISQILTALCDLSKSNFAITFDGDVTFVTMLLEFLFKVKLVYLE